MAEGPRAASWRSSGAGQPSGDRSCVSGWERMNPLEWVRARQDERRGSAWPWLRVAGLGAAAWQALALTRALLCGREIAREAVMFEICPPQPQARVLMLGDSTGVGVGCGSSLESLSALLAAEFPRVEIINACRNGARVADTLTQLHDHGQPDQGFDLVLVLAGGNDVLRLTSGRALVRHAQALLQEIQPRSRNVVWLGSADFNSAPALKPPLNWILGWHCRRTMKRLDRVVSEAGAKFIDFSDQRHSRIFSARPRCYFAIDGMHPSSAGYKHGFDELQRRALLANLLGRHGGSLDAVAL